MKSKDLQPRLLYPARLSFRIQGEIRSFPEKIKLKECVNTKPVLQQMLNGLEGGRRKKKKKKKKEERRRRGKRRTTSEENSLTIKWH